MQIIFYFFHLNVTLLTLTVYLFPFLFSTITAGSLIETIVTTSFLFPYCSGSLFFLKLLNTSQESRHSSPGVIAIQDFYWSPFYKSAWSTLHRKSYHATCFHQLQSLNIWQQFLIESFPSHAASLSDIQQL